MSYWTHINGAISVKPLGRTQPEKRYILETVLEHLPEVTGSEQNIHVDVLQKHGHSGSCNVNEFQEWNPKKSRICTQDTYHIVIDGDLRDRMFEETLHELNKWLNRLAKRVGVVDICIKLTGYKASSPVYEPTTLIISDPSPYRQMEESPSWGWDNKTGEPAWAEYLMWDHAKDSSYPMKLVYKYWNDPENDAEVERRMAYEKD